MEMIMRFFSRREHMNISAILATARDTGANSAIMRARLLADKTGCALLEDLILGPSVCPRGHFPIVYASRLVPLH